MTFNRVMFKSASDDWSTPKDVYDKLDQEFHFDYDPCPLNCKENNLYKQWGKSNFVNPPYSQIKEWSRECWIKSQLGALVVMLIPSRTDTKWWHDYVMKAKEIRFIKGRLKFGNAKYSAPFPSAIVIFNQNLKES